MKTTSKKSADGTQEDRKRNDSLNHHDKKQNNENKLPGDYPPQEDIMNRLNTKRVNIDVDNFSRSIGAENLNIKETLVSDPNDILEDPIMAPDYLEENTDQGMEHPISKNLQKDVDISERNESDVTEEDLQALGPKDLSMDMGDDEALKNRVWPVDMAGEDLDIPGTELDDANEAIGSEDEENNGYSLGGDNHEDK